MSKKKRTPEQERQRQARRRESKRAAHKCHDCANPAEPDRTYCTDCLNRRRATPLTYFERVEKQMTAVAPDPIAEPLPKPEPLRDALVTSPPIRSNRRHGMTARTRKRPAL